MLAEEADECPGCRGSLTESTEAGNEFRYRAEAIRCHRCAAQQREMTAMSKANAKPEGLLVTATLKT